MAMDLGVAVGPGLDTMSADNDLPTTCDDIIIHSAIDVHPLDCRNPGEEKWTNKFDGGTGVLAGLALGYREGNFRIEGEYFYRNATHNDASEPSFGGVSLLKEFQEISESEEAIDDLISHNFFTNLYYDFTSDSKWTPYLGMGVGFAQVKLDYFNRFTRSSNPGLIKTFDESGYDDAQKKELKAAVAGTTTIGRSKLSDTLFGYQAIAGVDYRISEPVTIGLKFRWVDFGKLKDSDEYRQLRSHDSTNSFDSGTHPVSSARVRYRVKTDDIEFWGLSLNMKYHF